MFQKKTTIIILILIITNLLFLTLLIQRIKKYNLAESQMIVMSQYSAACEASIDFEKGNLRLYELRRDAKREFANSYDGPFEIWYMPIYPNEDEASKKSVEAFVEMYNKKMKRMHQKKEDAQSD